MAPAEEKDKYSRDQRRMTPELLQDICKERHMWSQPHLNTQLYLNHKGFDAIECLEDYVLVKSLHLGSNNIARIEGLDRMSELRSLHLEGNRITKIENLWGNLDLRQLNLEGNGITRVDCLSHLTKLEHVNLSHNAIKCLEDLEGLRSLPSLSNIDVSHNELEATDGVVEFWSGFAACVKVLRYHGNPGVRNIEHYRKRLVNAMPDLSYLDERPVFLVERRSCAAWATGGMQAMQQAKRDFHEEQHRKTNMLDPERREHLTRMRKVAIARIEREAREREEQMEEAEKERRQKEEVEANRVEGGDLEALAKYAQSWQQKVNLLGAEGVRAQVSKVNLLGAEGVRAQVSKDTSSQQHVVGRGPTNTPCSSQEPAVARHTPSAHSFAPPPRGADSDKDPRPLGAHATGTRGAIGSGRPVGASEFIALRRGTDDATEASLQDRQFAVLGDDDAWAGRSTGTGWAAAAAARGNAGNAGGPRLGPDPPAMPQIWERLQDSNKEAELRALEMNLANSGGGAGASAGQDELSGLD